MPLSGDRNFGEDEAIVGGLGKLGGRRIMLIGHEKGDDTASRLKHNFGMGGGRRAIARRSGLMELARPGRPAGGELWSIPPAPFPACRPRSARQAEAIAPLDRGVFVGCRCRW